MKFHALILNVLFVSLSIIFNGCKGYGESNSYMSSRAGSHKGEACSQRDFVNSLNFSSVRTVAIFPVTQHSQDQNLTKSVLKILKSKGVLVHDFTEKSSKFISHDFAAGEPVSAVMARTNSSIQEFAFSSEVQGSRPEWVLVPEFKQVQYGGTNIYTGETSFGWPVAWASLKLLSPRDGGKTCSARLASRRLEGEPNWDMLAEELIKELYQFKQQ